MGQISIKIDWELWFQHLSAKFIVILTKSIKHIKEIVLSNYGVEQKTQNSIQKKQLPATGLTQSKIPRNGDPKFEKSTFQQKTNDP